MVKPVAQLLNQTSDSESASKLIQGALPAAEALARLPDAGVAGERILGEFYNLLAILASKRDLNQALVYARHGIDIFSGLAERQPDHADFVFEQDGYALLGKILNQHGDSRGSLEQFLRCAELREALVKSRPNDVVYKRNLMISYGHVGDQLGSPVMFSLGDSAGVRVYYRKAVAIGEEIYNADPNASWRTSSHLTI